MKKLILGISVLMLGLLIGIVIISKSKHITIEDVYYTIPRIQTYHYDEEKKMSFEVFVNNENSLIEFSEQNSYAILEDKNRYPLTGVRITKEKNDTYEEEHYYKYTIWANLFSLSQGDTILNDCLLEIDNATYKVTLPVGYIGIYGKEYKPLEFRDLYGNYSYIDGELHLVGITIELDSSYKRLEQMHLGPAFLYKKHIEHDVLYDSELSLSTLKHTLVSEEKEESSYLLLAKYDYYFLPISYPKKALITSACIIFKIDGVFYYLEDFTYLANNIKLSGYKEILQKGKVSYA